MINLSQQIWKYRNACVFKGVLHSVEVVLRSGYEGPLVQGTMAHELFAMAIVLAP